MAGTRDDMGEFKGLEGDAGLTLTQDLQKQVSGGTMEGNENVCADVFIGRVSVCDPVGDVGVETGGVVVGKEGNDGGLHGENLVESGSVGVVEGEEADCEVKVEDQAGLKDAGVDNGEVVDGAVGNDCEVKVEDQLGLKDEIVGKVENEEVPKFDADKLRKQIKDAQMLVEEKTTRRDDIQLEIKMKRVKLQSIFNKFEGTKSNERGARRSVMLKRQEIVFIQDRINKVKNSISVINIDERIRHMEYMIELKTNPLKEENQLLHEISTLRKLQDQISSNVCFENEDNSHLSLIVPMEMQLKTLNKELADFKAKVSNAQAAGRLLGQEYNEEYKKLGEFQAQFRAANDVCQDAYQEFLGLKRQLHEKLSSWVEEEPKKKMVKDKTSSKPLSESGSVSHTVSGRLQSSETVEEKTQKTEEELELERKTEMLRQEEAAKLKEKLREEEKAKAREALERKRRNAEKAQMRSMLRAQKEAEQKEKEKEKRLRKKERKNAEGESGLEVQPNSTMEESTDTTWTKLKKSFQSNKHIKPKAAAIPPALRNRGRRQILNAILCWILAVVGTLFVLTALSDSSFGTVKPRTKGDSFSGEHRPPI
ncbi:hypothetical protein AgCh_010461 [Apium graveolens]